MRAALCDGQAFKVRFVALSDLRHTHDLTACKIHDSTSKSGINMLHLTASIFYPALFARGIMALNVH
jgi:hypothetical protein